MTLIECMKGTEPSCVISSSPQMQDNKPNSFTSTYPFKTLFLLLNKSAANHLCKVYAIAGTGRHIYRGVY